MEFFREQGLTSSVLRSQYLAQVRLLKELFLEQKFNEDTIRLYHQKPLEQNGGFFALRSPHARTIRARLLEKIFSLMPGVRFSAWVRRRRSLLIKLSKQLQGWQI